MAPDVRLAVIGGSGLYKIPGMKNVKEKIINTPFGMPSSPIVTGSVQNREIAFLARHGIGHTLMPSEINYRANIFALKSIGVERIISISACGSLREDYAPGDIVIPDQLYDNTHRRIRTFFGDGLVAHISVADPFCRELSQQLESAIKMTGAVTHRGGSIITIEGPRFSTKAESNTYRAWGMSIIGMTSSPEAFLAREAEMCYGVMSHVTDYDVWHANETPVTVEKVMETLHKNTSIAIDAIVNFVSKFDTPSQCDCHSALASAIITDPTRISADKKEQLRLLINKYIV